MATKRELLKEAKAVGRVHEEATEDDFTVADLEMLLGGDVAAWEGSLSARKPVVAPDGHVNLSKEDIEARG